MCSPKACKDVFYPNVTIFQSNCAEGSHLVLFIYNAVIARLNFCVQCYTYPVLYSIVIVDQMDYSTLSGIFMDNSQTMNMTKISKNYLIHGTS